MSFTPNTRLGPYEILSPIGEGGMGEVWKARDTRLDRIVAIKRLKGEHSARFQQEARAIAALNHPHICQIYDIGPDYLVLEYVEGKPLQGPMPFETAMKLALQIASALEAAHKRNILHRDLKPANILVTESGAKLLDFGLAKLMANSGPDVTQTVEGAVMGTAAYMSPEQAQGKTADERSDIFSFGTVLYELLSGRRAFTGNSMLETLNAVVRMEPEPLQSPLQSILKRCLAKESQNRFQTVAEVRAALEQCSPAKPVEQRPSIAVLPFANMSPDKDNEYFSDGLAEEIINALTKLGSLKVIARTSCFAFRGKELDIRKIAEALDVNTILEGSVRKAGNRVRITAQLVNAADGAQLWSERYDRELNDVFAIQDEISVAIANQLRVSLMGAPVATDRPRNLAAYEAFLEGRHHWMQLTPAALERSLVCYRRAVAADPEYALAHAGIAEYYAGLAMLALANPAEVLAKGREAASRSLELNPETAEGHSWMGHIRLFLDYDWAGSQRSFLRAIEISPEPGGYTRFPYALWHLIPNARWQEAEVAFDSVIQLDPVNLNARFGKALALDCQGRIDEALAVLERAMEISGTNNTSLRQLAYSLARRKRFDEALVIVNRALDLQGRWSLNIAAAGLVHAMAGQRDAAHRCIEELIAASQGGYVPAERIAGIYSLLQERDLAFEWAEKSLRQRDPFLLWLPVNPTFDGLRSDTRYPELLRKMNLG